MGDIEELSRRWNEAGRRYFGLYEQRLAKYYGEGDDSVDLDLEDPRTAADGDAVLSAVIALNAEGRHRRARALFDPAYAPLFHHIQKNDHRLAFVTLLGEDELLVRRGAPFQADAVTFHLRNGRATPLPGVRGMARSRGRGVLVLAREGGLEFRDARAPLGAAAVATLPWPEPTILRPRGLSPELAARWVDRAEPLAVETMQVSDDGTRVVVGAYRQGVLLASRRPGEPPWQLLLPDARPPYGWGDSLEEDGEVSFHGDMTHGAISRDGTRLAFGEQSSPHYLAEIDAGGEPAWYATVTPFSEYAHDACFSDDGAFVALNSCHYYSGATRAFDWSAGNKENDPARLCEETLRVYASCWLPESVVGNILPGRSGAFALSGVGILRCVRPDGQLVFVQGFGSSASSIDYCPESNRLALGSYSGMVHVYDPKEAEHPGRIDGFRARRELERWILWKELPNGPVCW